MEPIRRVLISATRVDSPWAERVRSAFRRAWPDAEVIVSAEVSPDALPSVLEGVAVAVVLLSPDHLESSAGASELSMIATLARERRLLLLWTTLWPVVWKRSTVADFQAAADPDRPLGTLQEGQREALIEHLVKQAGAALASAPAGERTEPAQGLPYEQNAPVFQQKASPPWPGSPPRGEAGAAQVSSPPVSPPVSASPPPEPPPPEVGASPAATSPAATAGTAVEAPGYFPDTVGGKDRLDVSREAYRLAMVVAHEDVEPPLSVGLFGDWGSGKSFFMKEMRSWIGQLTKQSCERPSSRFCKNVVQLEFNAWHYMDSNLWASLAREICEGLATAVADTEAPALGRIRLEKATQSTRDALAATEAELAPRARALEDTDRRLGEIAREQPALANVTAAALQAALNVIGDGNRGRWF